jgi:hypothetical protein
VADFSSAATPADSTCRSDDPWCVGSAFDGPATHIADGWACAVAVAPDALGNLGLSHRRLHAARQLRRISGSPGGGRGRRLTDRPLASDPAPI